MRRPAGPLLALALALGPGAGVVLGQGQLSEVLVDVQEDAQPLRDVLDRLEEAHGLNYVVSQRAVEEAGAVTVHLEQVPLDVALESICAACGLNLEVRGPVLVILPREQRPREPLPRVDEGLPRSPGSGTAAAPSAPAEEEEEEGGAPADADPAEDDGEPPSKARPQRFARAVGTLVEVDAEDGRIRLRIDGVKRDFFLPEPDSEDPFQRASRLQSSLKTLKPGGRIALLYRPDATRPVVTNLIGGAHAGSKRSPARDRRRASEAEASEDSGGPAKGSAESATEAPRPEGRAKVDEAGGAGGAQAAPEPSAKLPKGALAGTFVDRDAETVRIRRGDGSVVTCVLPPKSDANEGRREGMIAAIDALKKGDKLFVTVEETEDGERRITNAIAQARR